MTSVTRGSEWRVGVQFLRHVFSGVLTSDAVKLQVAEGKADHTTLDGLYWSYCTTSSYIVP
jgi:hypothetical protein